MGPTIPSAPGSSSPAGASSTSSAPTRALGARLGQSDRRRIDDHLQGLRDLERGLDISTGAACAPKPPAADPAVDLGHEDLDPRNKLLTDVVAMALACNLSRVLVVTYSTMQADTIFWQVGAVDGNHVVTHDGRGLPDKKPPQKELHGKIVRYIMGHLGQLLTRLRHTPEGPATCSIAAPSWPPRSVATAAPTCSPSTRC